MQPPFSTPPKLADSRARRNAVISLTPLIDVVFILLIFFMLASNFLDWKSLALDTSAAASEPAPSEQAPFLVAIRDDELLLNGEAVSLPALIQRAQTRQPLEQPVSLQPLGDTAMQRLVTVLDALNGAGITPLNLVDDPQWQPQQNGEGAHALP